MIFRCESTTPTFKISTFWAFYAVSAVHKSYESRIFKIIVLIAGFVIVCPKCSLYIPTQFEKKTNSTSNNNAVWRNEGIKDVQEIKLWRKMCKSLLAILWFRDILFMNNHVLKKGYWIGFVLGIFVPLENFSLKYRRHHYRWRAANFDLYSALMAIEGSFACHTYCDSGHPFIMVISEDPLHSHLLPNV